MQHRISQVVGALFLGLWLGCAGDMAAGEKATSDGASQSQAGANGHHHYAGHGADGQLSLDERHPEKLVLALNAPASFSERPAVGAHFTCSVSGGVFEMEPHTRVAVYEGRHYAFCCGGCAQDFDANPDFFVNRVKDAQVVQ